jgi:4a-hydroxytetrahydrobiopterin dehydratase
MRNLLTNDAIEAWLSSHPEWSREGDLLHREFRFASFPKAIAFVGRVAEEAEAMDHHPDIDIRYDRVRIGLSTHSAGGITEMDTGLAEQVDWLAG